MVVVPTPSATPTPLWASNSSSSTKSTASTPAPPPAPKQPTCSKTSPNASPPFFIYAGINVTDTPLFTGTRGAQLAGRATLVDCGPLPARHGTREPFRDVITDIENALDLHRHKPGTLPRHAPYLHQRTAGRIGCLTRLIRQAAITAIHDGTEHITMASLQAIRLDHLAETHHRPTRGR
ncbi:hypothetical protein ACWGI0_26065 [Streptomyces sp. NPDC054802]